MLQVGDGVKKWAVLAPTAALPRAPRVTIRRHLLARPELKAERTGLLIVGHPKSGNTWLRDYFTPEQAAEIEGLVIARLSPSFGYVPERASHPAQLAV